MAQSIQPSNLSKGKRRYPLWRLVRANFYDLGLLLRESWVVLIGFAILALAGTLYFNLSPSSQQHGRGLANALYQTLLLLTLQSGEDFPKDLIGQFLFFLIPLIGLAL